MMKRLLPQLMILFFVFTAGISSGQTFQDAEEAYKNKDYKKAFEILKPLAEQGNARAQYFLEKTIAKAAEQAAKQGDAEAQLHLGAMYHTGQGVTQDYEKALKWYSLAVIQGKAKAKAALGFMYDQGHGVPQDYQEAAKWYRLAAEHGLAMAQSMLGEMYLEGKGVPQDYMFAHMWWNLAGSNGHKDAKSNRIIVEKRMTTQQIEKAQEMARNWSALRNEIKRDD